MSALARSRGRATGSQACVLLDLVLDHAGVLVPRPALAVVKADRLARVRDQSWDPTNVVVEVIAKAGCAGQGRTEATRTATWASRNVGSSSLVCSEWMSSMFQATALSMARIYGAGDEFSPRALRGFRMPVIDVY